VREEKGEILYQISTRKGQSGAPVIRTDRKGKLSVVGIHTGVIKTTINGESIKMSGGRFLSPELIELLQQKAKELKGGELKVASGCGKQP
jgi:V8-like Glu-specific endopeptidase